MSEQNSTELRGQVIVITGASSGIGEATARYLAGQGARVVLGARRQERLDALVADIRAAGGVADARATDVTRREDLAALVRLATESHGQLDVLVNNAGVMPLSPLDALKVDEWDRMIDVNIRGVLYGVAAALPVMVQQGRGHVINVSSIGAYQVSPTAAVYCASKCAVNAISEGLRQEQPALRVTIVAPGVTESELAESISDEAARDLMREYRQLALPALSIAQAIGYAITQPQAVSVNELVVRPTGAH
ncbi:SDR family NAD(P)-dependent oxidoreductase [Deinococcus sp. HMF7620]|uniref:SDR family NAD(P)-dependent oxidoreductase n=1 Tax=Deinococcus arboris TaxID=2682977 RepID=A0A7C9HTA2_9DEIO|nr:SDR family oxidoreductase [Deinococcus arboris]MVN88227.1 SDR family NAD(P)-dependent oxidoreductase [Deinococcus arboris]